MGRPFALPSSGGPTRRIESRRRVHQRRRYSAFIGKPATYSLRYRASQQGTAPESDSTFLPRAGGDLVAFAWQHYSWELSLPYTCSPLTFGSQFYSQFAGRLCQSVNGKHSLLTGKECFRPFPPPRAPHCMLIRRPCQAES